MIYIMAPLQVKGALPTFTI